MKKIFIVLVSFNFCFAYAQKVEDPTVMTVANIEVPLSEFLFLAQKDSEVDLLNKKSLENYVELFKNFKLKVAEAMSLRIQESLMFRDELSNYQAQLMASYLSDREGEVQEIRKVYERGKELLKLSHIIFLLPEISLPTDTLEVYTKAYNVYKRLMNGEDFTTIGQALEADENSGAHYADNDYLFPLQAPKVFEDVAYTMSEGEISAPVRTPVGFHIIRLNQRIADPGRVLVAHILIKASDDNDPDEEPVLLKIANEAYERIRKGEEFEKIAKEYSDDEHTREIGGVLPLFGLGTMVMPFEQAAFSLEQIGDVSAPVRTRFGYHILKLLDKREYPSYEEMEQSIYVTMKQGEWKHELSKTFDERQKAKFGYTFNQEAYNELLKLCEDYFPADTGFYNLAITMTKSLMRTKETNHLQDEFAEYVRLKASLSSKTYSGDMLNEMFLFFVREIMTELEKRDLENNQEFIQLINEYHDGILLFEVSSTRVWDKPVEEQAKLEKEWLEELNKKYKVDINWKVLNNLKNYLK